MAKELSIFIDESGNFDKHNHKSPYYIIGMVIHEQDNNISSHISRFNERLAEIDAVGDFVHIGPLIRGEKDYRPMFAEERARILWRMMSFVKKTPFTYVAFSVEKKHINDDAELVSKLARQLIDFMRGHLRYFIEFDQIKVYYDNGQAGVTQVIITAFTALFHNVEFKKAAQKDYRLLQVADLVCTARLLELKIKDKTISKSERHVLGSDRDINKNIFKLLKLKEFKE